MSYELSEHVREVIDDWKTRFPEDRQRSAVIVAAEAERKAKEVRLLRLLMQRSRYSKRNSRSLTPGGAWPWSNTATAMEMINWKVTRDRRIKDSPFAYVSVPHSAFTGRIDEK